MKSDALVKNITNSKNPTYVRMHKLDVTKDIFEEKIILEMKYQNLLKSLKKRVGSYSFN